MTTAKELLLQLPDSFLSEVTSKEYLCGALDACYSAPARHYHTLDHIKAVLERLRAIRVMTGDSRLPVSNEFYAAILFHDAVYDIHAAPTFNEQASAILASRLMVECMSINIKHSKVSNLIMATTHTRDLCGDPFDHQLIADLDMGGFCQESEAFLIDNDNVTKEYERFYTPGDTRVGRIDFLKKLNSREFIYYTKFFSDDIAKINIELAIHKLENS